jgi:hypothetical protein
MFGHFTFGLSCVSLHQTHSKCLELRIGLNKLYWFVAPWLRYHWDIKTKNSVNTYIWFAIQYCSDELFHSHISQNLSRMFEILDTCMRILLSKDISKIFFFNLHFFYEVSIYSEINTHFPVTVNFLVK